VKKIIIAIDGPAASGKSTTALIVAQRLGYTYIDTGAMYRAMTVKVLEKKIKPEDVEAVQAIAPLTTIRLQPNSQGSKVILDGRDVSDEIRSIQVTRAVSAVSSYPLVRELMVKEQREMGRSGGVVAEGRDIGTTVFPQAELKIFMIASAHERAVRRQKDLKAQGVEVDLSSLEQEIVERDRKDATRVVSPFIKAEDAIILDTTNITIEQQVSFILVRAKELVE
jgi:cytidylate kinase